MEFTSAIVLLASGLSAVSATPTRRRDNVAVTDELMFSITLPQFTSRRNANDPSTVIWTSDGCTSSPDNPFGFPFEPACNRHDFGYHNFRDQQLQLGATAIVSFSS